MKNSSPATVKLTVVAALGWLLAVPAPAAEPTRAQLEFFENKIRPTFVSHCYKCHSAAEGKSRGGLMMDTRDALLKGGDSGPALVPGQPERSLIIKAIRYTDPDLQMPPKGEKLSDSQIADLVAWVQMGAPDPRTGTPAIAKGYGGADKSHWAFQPVRNPPVPVVRARDWVATPVDAFALAKLEAKGLKPSPSADKRTLIRRATLDLTGLPPTPEEVQAFLKDNSADAFAKVIDRLLNSKHYGERWGRHWLDVARYSDTKGEVNTRREPAIYPYAWTYRDYVIESFNEDKPYDRFLIEQIAADHVQTPANDRSVLAALGFLTLGNRFNGNALEIINDRIDTLTKSTLALTVACARCHDHMFDPIPTKDYYSLHGIFASSFEPDEKPLLGPPQNNQQYKDYLAQRTQLEMDVRSYLEKTVGEILTDFRLKSGAYLLATRLAGSERAAFQQKNKLTPENVRLWQRILGATRNNDPVFTPWHAFAALPERDFARQARPLATKFAANQDKSKPLNPYIAAAFRGASLSSMTDVAAIYGRAFQHVDQQWQTLFSAYERRQKMTSNPGPAPTRLADPHLETLRLIPLVVGVRNISPEEAMRRLLSLRQQRSLTNLETKLAQLELDHPGAPARAMALADSPKPTDSRVFIRGEASNRGDVAPRQFLEVLSGPNRQPFKLGSGRVELARAIASKSNPLTARVMVNRIWMHHFGEGFVDTPDDFGTQSEAPSHPELLDYLAARFMAEGWSVKKMHRLIMLSNTYQQSSEDNPRFAQIDPDNRLLWRANIRKLDFEVLRDSILAIGGKLDLTVGGKPVDLDQPPYRRTVYGFVDRANLPEVFNHFDFANPDIATGKRYETIVPQQSLFLMNNPIVIEQARNLVRRPDFQSQRDDQSRITLLYELIYQRLPKPDELKLGLSYLSQMPASARIIETAPPAAAVASVGTNQRRPAAAVKPAASANRKLNAWEQYAHALLLTNETSFVN